MKLTQLMVYFLVCNKIFIANAVVIKRNRLNVKQSSTPDSDAYDEGLNRMKAKHINDDNGVLMKAMLMECPRTGDKTSEGNVFSQQEERSKGRDMCHDKILVKISVEHSKKFGKGDDKYLIIDEVYDTRRKTKAKLSHPYVIEIKQSDPIFVYPLEVIENISSNKCHKLTDSNDDEDEREKIAYKYFNLDALQHSFVNPFVSNTLENVKFYPNSDDDQLQRNDVTITKRQRDPIRACHYCNNCQICDSEISEDGQVCSCAACQECLENERNETNQTNPVNPQENDITEIQTKARGDNNKIFQYFGIDDLQSKMNQKKYSSNEREIQYNKNKNKFIKHQPSISYIGTSDGNNLKQWSHMKNENMYAKKPVVHTKFNTFVEKQSENVNNNNRYEDTNTLVKSKDMPSNLFHVPSPTKDIEYYSDYYEDDVPSLWTVADTANMYSDERYLKLNEIRKENGNEITKQNEDKSYDALMMDRNLTPNDKIQFLATNFDPQFAQSVVNDNNNNHRNQMTNHGKFKNHEMRRKKRGFYDDMSYFDDYNLYENSKYNGDWYRYLMANFPQLSNEEQKQQQTQDTQRQQDKTVVDDIIKDVENINNENNNNNNNNDDKSVSSGRQKLFKEDAKQRSHSVDKLWTVFKINVPLPYIHIRIRIFQKQEHVWTMIHPDINVSNYLSHYADKHHLITLSFHTASLTNLTNRHHNANAQNTNLFNLLHRHYLLISPNSVSPSLSSKMDDFLVFDLPIIFNENDNTSNRSLHWMKILEKICNGLLLHYNHEYFDISGESTENGRTISSTIRTTQQSQGKNQHHNAVVDKRRFKSSHDHKKKIFSTINGNKNERITEKNKKRDAFNLHNDNGSHHSENRTITFTKLNELPNFPVISHDDRVINDCPTDIKEYHTCLFVQSNQEIFQDYQLTMKFLDIDTNTLQYPNTPHTKVSIQQHHSTPIHTSHKRQHVRITNIFIDGTIYALLMIRVFLVNLGARETNFTVMIDDYTHSNIFGEIDVAREVILRPNKEKMVEFRLRHSIIHDNMKQIKCSVKVLSSTDIISSRELLIQPKARCLCVSHCACVCIGAYFDTKQEGIVSCHIIKSKNKIQAGFMDSFPDNIYYDDEQQPTEAKLIFDPVSLFFLPLFVILFVFLLGLLKALLGLCIHPIGKWGYNYMQPFHKYERSTKCRQFRMNLIFFFIVPCLYCCSKCCGKWTDSSNLETSDRLEKGRLKKQFIIKQEKYEINEDISPINSDIDSDIIVPSEHSNLLYPFSSPNKKKRYNKKSINNNNNRQVADVTPQNHNNNNHSSQDRIRRASAGFVDYTIDEEKEEEEDTSFVLSALTESRDSMRCLGGIHSDSEDDKCSSEVNAFIEALFSSQIFYRVFSHPVGNIVIEDGQKYAIRGFFIPSSGKKYKFITNLPLRQHWKIDKTSQNLLSIFPPLVLLSREFTKVYQNKQDVFDSQDLLVKPHISTPVLNMQLQTKFVYDDDDTHKNTHEVLN